MPPRKKEIQAENLPELIKVAKIAKADQLVFNQFKKVADEWAEKAKKIVVNTVADTEAIEQAKEGYDYLNNKYKDLDTFRKDLGEDSRKRVDAINGMGNYFKGLIEPVLLDLKTKAEFKKNAEKKSKDAIADKRLEELSKFGSTLARDVAASMTEDVYQNYLKMAEKTYNELLKDTTDVGVSNAIVEPTKTIPVMMVGQQTGSISAPTKIVPKSDKEKLQEFCNQLNLLQYPDVDNTDILIAFQDLDQSIQHIKSLTNKL